MIKTKEYVIVKSRRIPITSETVGIWTQIKKYGRIESLKEAKEVLKETESGEVPGHSEKCLYKIMEVCYCDIGDLAHLLNSKSKCISETN